VTPNPIFKLILETSLHPRIFIVTVRNMFLSAFLIGFARIPCPDMAGLQGASLNPPVPHIRRAHVESFVKGGTYEGLKVYQHTYGRNEHSRRIRRSPLFQKGGQGGFNTVGHSLQSEHIYDISYKCMC